MTPLPLGIDLDPYLKPSAAALAAEAAYRGRYAGPIWLSVGRLNYYKALHVGMGKRCGIVLRTLLVVGTGPLLETWRLWAIELGVVDRVDGLATAGADELVGAYRAATAFWFPSNARSEGFGLVQIEAMASACRSSMRRFRTVVYPG